MKAEREKWSGRVTATALRFQTGQYELAEEEEICRIILVSGGSFTLVRGGESLLVNPGCVLLLGPAGACCSRRATLPLSSSAVGSRRAFSRCSRT